MEKTVNMIQRVLYILTTVGYLSIVGCTKTIYSSPSPADADKLAMLPAHCENKFSEACYILADMYDKGYGVSPEIDYSMARFFHKKACELNVGLSCNVLGYYFHVGEGIQQNYVNAIPYYEKSCSLQNQFGCANLGVLYRDGLGVETNLSSAKQYFEKACFLNNPPACNDLAELHENSGHTDFEPEKAQFYYDKACRLGETKACRDRL